MTTLYPDPMRTKILDGTACAKRIKAEALEEAGKFKKTYHRRPHLAVILIGNNPASQVYVRNKAKDCVECGIDYTIISMGECTEAELLTHIAKLNADKNIDGILVQLPLPESINVQNIMGAIHPSKDVDGFTPENTGRLWSNNNAILKPCTPSGIIDLLAANIDMQKLAGRHAVIVNRSNIVGKPIASMLLDLNMTVTICHSHTTDLRFYLKSADLLVTAVGKPHFIQAKHIKPGSIVIDVSMNRDEQGKLCGDCDDLTGTAGYVTPVPGGIGPMTRAILMQNVNFAAYYNMARQIKGM